MGGRYTSHLLLPIQQQNRRQDEGEAQYLEESVDDIH